MPARYAIYYAPPRGSELAEFGSRWLGRDPDGGGALSPMEVPGLTPERLHQITESPRFYAFHGTLKAPFELASGETAETLHEAAAAFAASRGAFSISRLMLASLSGFLALVPSERSPALERFAGECVEAFDGFRAPLSDHDVQRRLKNGISQQEEAYLRRWGYPYVFEFFRFHLTLTERLAEPEHARVRAVLEPLVAPLCREPLAIRDLCVFEQPSRDQPFLLSRRYPLAAA